jgi:D-galactose 1-dehydrogenase
MHKIKIGVVGFGKIARDQHLPALAASSDFELIAITHGAHPPPHGLRVHESLDDMLAGSPEIEAVSLCTPPQGRHALARRAIDRRLHVIMEKPPGQTLSEVEDLIVAARSAGVALFATWHSRAAPAVDAARRRLANAVIRQVVVTWKEDVRRWHPGQSWIWQAGGFGVFDPGINALSIVTRILPRSIFPTAARLSYPANRDTPIAAVLELTDSSGTAIHADFDWRHTGTPSWDIVVHTDDGALRLSDGGAVLSVDGEPVALPAAAEYPNLYQRFAELVRERCIDVDLAPLRLIADAFMLGQRKLVEAFYD